jgi:hypothetical protein
MRLPDKDAAIEVDAEAEEGLDVTPVAVSVALQALQQDPETHANRSIHLPSINPPAIDQSTCHRSIKPSGLPHSNPLINLAGRNTKSIHLSGRHRTIIQSNQEGCHTTIHQPNWQIAAKLSINQSITIDHLAGG